MSNCGIAATACDRGFKTCDKPKTALLTWDSFGKKMTIWAYQIYAWIIVFNDKWTPLSETIHWLILVFTIATKVNKTVPPGENIYTDYRTPATKDCGAPGLIFGHPWKEMEMLH